MRRIIITVILLLQCLLASASAAVLVIDLENEVNADLLSYSEYYLDKKSSSNFATTAELPNSAWTRFDRNQLRFGFTDSPVWLRTTVRTSGSEPKEIVFALHKVLNNIMMRVTKVGGSSQLYTFRKTINKNSKLISNLNSTSVTLEPNQTYQFLVQINSTSPVIGTFTAIDSPMLEKMVTQMNQWVMMAILLIILVAIYNGIVFVSSRHPAIIAHLFYVLSILGYLLNDFGFIQKWTDITQLGTVQRISAIFLITSILSLIAFFRAMSVHEKYNYEFKRIYQFLFLAGYTLIPVMFLIRFQNVLQLIIILTVMSITVGFTRALITWKENKSKPDRSESYSLSLTLVIVLATLVPSVMLHILSRRGIIDVLWYTEFVLFASIILEVMLISVVLFLNIRKNKEAYQYELHNNNVSDLPNVRALKECYTTEVNPNNKTMFQVWISGLDELQIAFGPHTYQEFLRDTARQMSKSLLDIPEVIKYHNEKRGITSLFHSDKNTFTILSGRVNKATRDSMMERLMSAIETMSHLHHINIDLKLVVGAYEFDHAKNELNTAIVNCNLALAYSIKHNQKLKFYTPQMSFDEQQRLTLITDFRESLDNEDFFLLWQPQYDTQTSRIIGAEVLARWQHTQYGLISPDLFIPLLEQSSRICELSYWVIEEVLKQLPALHERHPGIDVSINLSPRDLIGNDLIAFLDSKLTSHAHLIPFITFEITENLLIDDYSQVLKNVEQLQSCGFKISIDDFGSGYSSFAYLQKLPANELKIDKIYTDSYLESSSNAILESMIFMAKRLNMRIVVEGIEHQQQIDLFKQLGAERLQGWMLDKPMPFNALLDKDTLSV